MHRLAEEQKKSPAGAGSDQKPIWFSILVPQWLASYLWKTHKQDMSATALSPVVLPPTKELILISLNPF